MTTLNREQTRQMLANLRDGDKPLEPGDTIETAEHGRLTVSKVYGWEDMSRLVPKDGAYTFQPVRALRVSWFKEGAKRAEVIHLMEPRTTVDDGGQG